MPGVNIQRARPIPRLNRILDQIHKHLLQPVGIAPHSMQVPLVVPFDFGIALYQPLAGPGAGPPLQIRRSPFWKNPGRCSTSSETRST